MRRPFKKLRRTSSGDFRAGLVAGFRLVCFVSADGGVAEGGGRGTLLRRSPESAGAASKRAMEGHVDCIRTFVRSMASVRVIPGLSEIRRIHSSRHLASTPITSVRRKPPYCPLRRRSTSRAAKETKAARTESHGAPSTLVANRGKPWNTRALMP